jgi:hypothetical protein
MNVVKKLHNECMLLERLLDDAALNPAATAMNEPHFTEAGAVRLDDVLVDDGWDIAGRECMKIEGALDGNAHRVVVWHYRFS